MSRDIEMLVCRVTVFLTGLVMTTAVWVLNSIDTEGVIKLDWKFSAISFTLILALTFVGNKRGETLESI